MSELSDGQVARLIEDRLEVYGVGATLDDASASGAMGEVVRAIERTWDLVIPDRLLDQVRDRGELVEACVARVQRHLRLRARRKVLPSAADLQVRVEPPAGYHASGISRGGTMTAYDAEELVAGALRWGPGARIDVVVSDDPAGSMVEALVDRTGALREGVVRVNVRRAAVSVSRRPTTYRPDRP